MEHCASISVILVVRMLIVDDDHDDNHDGKPNNCHNMQRYLMIHRWSRLSSGILVIGGQPSTQSVEFWSPSDSEEGSCELNDYPILMYRGRGPTANLVSGQLVACYDDTCEIYNGGGEWTHLADISSYRVFHTSAVKDDDRILLIGGFSRSTEWISMDGSPSQPGPFDVRHGYSHCTIQLSSDLILVTGGWDTFDFVTSYHLSGNGDETPQAPMNQGRYDHACGVYQDAGGQQVRRLWIHSILMMMIVTFLRLEFLEISSFSKSNWIGKTHVLVETWFYGGVLNFKTTAKDFNDFEPEIQLWESTKYLWMNVHKLFQR